MEKISKEQLSYLIEYRDFINEVGKVMPEIAETSQNKINAIQSYRYILGILFGTELVKVELRSLLVINDYIDELKKLVRKVSDFEIKKIKKYDSMSYGQVVHEFCENYKNFPEDIKIEMWGLNKKRNDIVHDAIFVYKGDLNKADEEIRDYITSQKINKLTHELTSFINTRVEEITILNTQIKEMGLI